MKLEDQLRDTIRFKHLSLKTEESYVGWYRRYVLWHGKRHPEEMGAAEVKRCQVFQTAEFQRLHTRSLPPEDTSPVHQSSPANVNWRTERGLSSR